MGLRHRLGRLLSDRLDKLRGKGKRPDRRYRPIFESLEQRVVMTGFWQALNPQNPTAGPAAGSKALMLLSNGDILVQGTPTLTQANVGPTDVWYRLTPDSTGNYVLGSWGSQSHMNVPRLYSPTAMLPDGRVIVVGGEYSLPFSFTNSVEIYDPTTNSWSAAASVPTPPTNVGSIPPPNAISQFGDDPIQVLPNGQVLAGYFNGPQTYIYNPATNSWRQTTGDKLRTDASDEETWIKLPDGSILSHDVFASEADGVFEGQRFIPSQDQWIDASFRDPLTPPGLLTNVNNFGAELGPGLLLPDGRAILFGANGSSAYYLPATNTWIKGPQLPAVQLNGQSIQLGATDNPAAMLPNGKILIALSPTVDPNTGLPFTGGFGFPPPTNVFEFDPTTQSFTDVTPPGLTSANAFVFNMLVLPTGQVLLGENGGNLLVYNPDGVPQDSWRPVIQNITTNNNGTFTLTGRQLNGISEGSSYGDDFSSASNYPILRMVDKSGKTVYARTFNWSSTGVATGGARQTVQFTLPSGRKLTDFATFTVVANGIPSTPFQNSTVPGRITGTKFNDVHGLLATDPPDGVREADEGGISHVMIYVDLNNDGKPGITEPATITDNFGHYTITGIPPGASYTVREVIPVGQFQTLPGPLPTALNDFSTIANAYSNVVVQANATTRLDFGDTSQPPAPGQDWGDAPDSYHTLAASNGPRAGILTNSAGVADFFLGATITRENDGQPSAAADADASDDGVAFVGGGVTPGTTGQILVTVVTGAHSPGKLQGWIDFNQNGVFDASERIVSNVTLAAGAHTLSFPVPATAKFGATFARFRYGYETDLAPTGPSIAGEVEDYQITVLPAIPIANPDVFPLLGDPPIRQGSTNNVLDVLANDTPTVFGAADIVPGSFPSTLPSGSTLTLGTATVTRNGTQVTTHVLFYTPAPNLPAPAQETFTYRVTDGHSESAPGTVTVNVSPLIPITIDDTFTEPASNSGPMQDQFHVMANDLFGFSDTQILTLTPVTPNAQTAMTIDVTNPTLVDFVAPVNFHGTEIWQYSIASPSDPTAISQTRFITVQVVDVTGAVHNDQLGGYNFVPTTVGPTEQQLAAIGYLADISVSITDLNGAAKSVLNVGDQFLLQVTAQDLRLNPTGDTTNRGVDAAYLDLLINRTFMQPVPNSDGTPAMPAITFSPDYTFGKSGQNGVIIQQQGQTVTVSAADEINEAGAAHDETGVGGVGPGPVMVFTVKMQAVAATPAGQPTKVVGDPADESATDVVLKNDPAVSQNPVTLNDTQVFLRQSANLTILGSGEGEFVNRDNPMDVNQDGQISAVDALIVINTLNAFGSGPVSSSVPAAPGMMIDVNMDSVLSPVDALDVINYLNTTSPFMARTTSSAGGEGEAESDVAATDLGGATDASLSTLSTSSSTPSAALLSTPTTSPTTASTTTTSGTSTPQLCTSTSDSAAIDAAAADDLYAGLTSSQQTLWRRFHR